MPKRDGIVMVGGLGKAKLGKYRFRLFFASHSFFDELILFIYISLEFIYTYIASRVFLSFN